MFLITTADQRFWKTDEPVLFLGDWCKLFSKRSVWEKLQYEVYPYHWDDRDTLYQDLLYLDRLYEKILLDLSNSLNKIHGCDHSLRYWRIIIGPWLSYFMHVLYDRFQSIKTVAESGKVTNTIIAEHDWLKWLPKDYGTLGEWVRDSDEYNHYLFSRIITYTNKIPFEVCIDRTKRNKNLYVKKKTTKIKKLITNLINIIFKYNRNNEIVLISTYVNLIDLLKLHLSLYHVPYLAAPDVSIPIINPDIHLRKKLLSQNPGNDFEKCLWELLIEQMPVVYVENFKKMKLRSLGAYPKKPKVIFTAVAYNVNEGFKIWAAHHAENGAQLVGTQHGGFHGAILWWFYEGHQIKIYDKFYTWGWKDVYDNTQYLAAAKFNKIKKRITPKTGGRLLLVEGTIPRYFETACTGLISSSIFLEYLDEQYRFVKGLSAQNEELLLVRLYIHDHGWSQKDRWKDKFPQVECSSAKKSLIKQLNESMLCICTYNGTTYLETFAANYPTLLFWNPAHCELRSLAQPYFEDLKRTGILHDTPESASAKVNEISHDPVSWWYQPEVQAAKDQFCLQYARTSDNWLKEWKTELQSVAHVGNKRNYIQRKS